jgi:hypothetical protein
VARFGFDQGDNGHLEVRDAEDGSTVDGFFVPKDGSSAGPRREGVKLLSLDLHASQLRINPINTLEGSDEFLGPKYRQVRTLTLTVDTYGLDGSEGGLASIDPDFELLLETLPPGFVKDFRYGLGLLKDCNRFIRLIEEHTECSEIVFADGGEVAVDGQQFWVGLEQFAAMWTEINRINSRGNRAAGRVKDAYVHNSLASALGVAPIEASLGKHPVSRIITSVAGGGGTMSGFEQDALIDAVAVESAALARSQPEKFSRLHREIELVSLDRLIVDYEAALGKRTTEQYWQTFFDDNAFALQQVFGTPMISVRSKASVGGGGIAGDGTKIADYLFKNSLTNNVALVEIKTPATPLLGGTAYRGGVFGPSKELNGAVTQVLDQAHQLTTNLATLKQNSRQWDLESYAVACFVIAGRTPTGDEPDKQKSFELHRANSRVTIVTYDEILERLKLLRDFLAPHEEKSDPDGIDA